MEINRVPHTDPKLDQSVNTFLILNFRTMQRHLFNVGTCDYTFLFAVHEGGNKRRKTYFFAEKNNSTRDQRREGKITKYERNFGIDT